jgi:hypothetical protein
MNSQTRPNPIVGRDAKFPFFIAVVCWIDLLGYGRMIAEADFSPLHLKASDAVKRLRHFHEIVASHSGREFPTLVMNDGAVAYRDLSLRSREPSYDFLMSAWNLFSEINRDEQEKGLPGARLVLATGFRMRGRRTGLDAKAAHLKSVMLRFRNGDIAAEQAIREAANIRQSFDIIPQLQANFAFSKAYVAESSGKGGGLGGPNFFVDLALFNSPMPEWVVAGKTVRWSHKRLRMEASFAPILALHPNGKVKGYPHGIRDGIEVAEHLSGDHEVLKALRAAQKAR